MSEDFEAPPMAGEGLPLKEQQIEQPISVKPDQQKKPGKPMVVLLIAILFLALGLILGLSFNIFKKPSSVSTPSSSVTSIPSPSPETQTPSSDMKTKLNNLDNNLKQVDLEEAILNPPNIDYKIRFKEESK